MAKITCAISGISFSCEHFSNSLYVSHKEGYYHPIFAASYGDLYKLYGAHCKGRLTKADSYLLFLAFLHSSDKVTWHIPCSLDPWSVQTAKLVENNIAQLLQVLEQSALVTYGDFSQPSFSCNINTSNLATIHNWIEAWQDNLVDFKSLRIDTRLRESLNKVEKELGFLILSGSPPEDFADIIALWADKAAGFPVDKAELWRKTITSCFSINKMFKTPLVLLKEIKDYCECNIEAGSIHFHTLLAVIGEGISRHVDYLGGSSLALGYTLLPSPKASAREGNYEVGDNKLLAIIDTAPTSKPIAEDYTSSLDFLKAKLAYTVASRKVLPDKVDTPTPASTNLTIKGKGTEL